MGLLVTSKVGPWVLDVVRTGGEWGGRGLHQSEAEMTADSSRERNSFNDVIFELRQKEI